MPSNDDLLEELAIIALDIVGIFDPTGVADVSSGVWSAVRGDWFGAGISVLGVVPYLGDLAKAGKLGRYAQTLESAVSVAISNSAFRQAAERSLRGIWNVLSSVNLRRLPTAISEPLIRCRTALARLFGSPPSLPAARVEWSIVESRSWQSLVGPTSVPTTTVSGGRRTTAIVSAGMTAPDMVRLRVNNRLWDVGRDTSRVTGGPSGNVFKHFAERAATVPPHMRSAQLRIMEEGMAAVMNEFDRLWRAGLLTNADTGAAYAAGALETNIWVMIDGWELAVDTTGDVWNLRHVFIR